MDATISVMVGTTKEVVGKFVANGFLLLQTTMLMATASNTFLPQGPVLLASFYCWMAALLLETKGCPWLSDYLM